MSDNRMMGIFGHSWHQVEFVLPIKHCQGVLLNNQPDAAVCSQFYSTARLLYMFQAFYTPIIRSTISTVSTATGTNHSIVSATFFQCGLEAMLKEGSWDDSKICTGGCRYSWNCTPDDGCVKCLKHVE